MQVAVGMVEEKDIQEDFLTSCESCNAFMDRFNCITQSCFTYKYYGIRMPSSRLILFLKYCVIYCDNTNVWDILCRCISYNIKCEKEVVRFPQGYSRGK